MWADLPAVETFPQLKTFPASWNEKDQKVDPGILSREDWDNNPLTKIQPMVSSVPKRLRTVVSTQ